MTKKAFFIVAFFLALTVAVGVVGHNVYAVDMANYKKAEVWWAPVAGAKKYHVYYSEKTDYEKWGKWNHSVRNVPVADQGMREITIGGLKPDVKYVARVAAVGWNGKEFWWSPVTDLMTK